MDKASPKLILENLINLRKNFTNIDEYLDALENLILNQKSVIESYPLATLSLDHIVDLLYDYSQITSKRDEVVIFKAAIEWLSFDDATRIHLAQQIFSLVKFESMSPTQLQSCFSPFFKHKLNSSIKNYLDLLEIDLLKRGILDHRLHFVRCESVQRLSTQ